MPCNSEPGTPTVIERDLPCGRLGLLCLFTTSEHLPRLRQPKSNWDNCSTLGVRADGLGRPIAVKGEAEGREPSGPSE